MAGGKETPRQKMIGMMYLVLTALLALNVSKSILDAFVAIEENTQKGNIAMVERGDGYYRTVTAELGALSANKEEGSKEKIESIKYAIEQMDKINEKTGKMIEKIDKLKLKILEESGEDVKKVKPNDELAIIWSEYKKEAECLPIRMNLMAVNAKDQYDVPMHVIIGENIKAPSGEGIKLWEDLLNYRKELMQLAGSYEWGGKQFEVKTKDINQYKTNKELTEKVKAMTYAEGVNPDDSEGLQNIYQRLTKLEKNEVHGVKDVHWIGMTFDHAPLVAALASLSSLQQDILSARSEALYLWKQKISTGEYSFDKIMPLAYGPSFARSGEDVEVQVMMAAFDSQNPPKVEVTQGMESPEITVENGVATVKFRAAGSSMDLKGTVAIQNKQGAWKQKEWDVSVPVLTPSGAIELTDLNVLYRGYPNKVMASGSGYETYSLSGSNASVSAKGNDQYIVSPGGGKSASLTITGKNADGTSSVLKKGQYRVSSLPDPVLYWGAAKSGKKGSRSSRILIAKYPPEIPLNAQFKVTKWTCYAPGLKGAPPSGAGSNIGSAGPLINAVPPGTGLSFTCTVVGPDGIGRQVGGSWSL